MILVDIYVPSVDREYNFSLNENVPIRTVIDEIVEMIGQKEQTFLAGDAAGMMLFGKEDKTVLSEDQTLTECGIASGASLLLI